MEANISKLHEEFIQKQISSNSLVAQTKRLAEEIKKKLDQS